MSDDKYLKIAVPLICFVTAMAIVGGCVAWRVVPPGPFAPQQMNQPKQEIKPPVGLKGNKTVMGHVSGQQWDGEELRVMVCTDQNCHNVTVTDKTEIIVTDLKGRRELNYTPMSLFDLLKNNKDCNAAVGINDGKVEMIIVYLPGKDD
jgi:hypothetical protein